MTNISHGLTPEQSHEYTRLRGQQWLSEDGMAPELSKEELATLARLERMQEGAATKTRRMLRRA